MGRKIRDFRRRQEPVARKKPTAKPVAPLLYLALCTLLASLIAVAFWPTIGAGFVYDDYSYVTNNFQVRQGISMAGIAWAFKALCAGNWHPLTMLSHMLDCELYDLKATGHHITSLLFHTANAILLFWVLCRMTHDLWKSFFVAALFAVHPLRVESVAWVAERKDVLSTFLWLLTALAYTHYASKPKLARYTLVFFGLAIGLLAKPMLVTLPLTLLILDYWPLERLKQSKNWKPLIIEKIPLAVLSVVSSFITLFVQTRSGALGSYQIYPLSARLENAILSYAKYILKTMWPSGLAVHYPYMTPIPSWQVALAAAFLILFTTLTLRLKNDKYLLAGWLWYLITLVPVIGIVQVGAQAMADRYTYVPLIGIFIMIAWGFSRLMEVIHTPKYLTTAAAGLILLTCVPVTIRQATYWRDEETLWKHALEVTVDNVRARNNLGNALFNKGKFTEALINFTEAVNIDPKDSDAQRNLGAVLFRLDRLDESIAHLTTAVRLNPNDAVAHCNLGASLHRKGDIRKAMFHYEEALKIQPEYPGAHTNLGIALVQQGRYAEAIPHFEATLRIDPNFESARVGLEQALAKTRPR